MPRSGDGPHAVDRYVGQKVRMRRIELGLSQEKLGEQIGITFQQIQKYERGANRISASRLYEIAKALSVSIVYFYDGLDQSGLENPAPNAPTPLIEDPDGRVSGEVLNMRMMQAFRAIADARIKRAILGLTQNLIGQDSEAEPSPDGDRNEV